MKLYVLYREGSVCRGNDVVPTCTWLTPLSRPLCYSGPVVFLLAPRTVDANPFVQGKGSVFVITIVEAPPLPSRSYPIITGDNITYVICSQRTCLPLYPSTAHPHITVWQSITVCIAGHTVSVSPLPDSMQGTIPVTACTSGCGFGYCGCVCHHSQFRHNASHRCPWFPHC